MRTKLLFAIPLCLLMSCTSKWEYKVVTLDGEVVKDHESKEFKVSDDDLNIFGNEGWELVDVYTVGETSYPNFGDKSYVTGIRENVRTKSVNYVFKRKK